MSSIHYYISKENFNDFNEKHELLYNNDPPPTVPKYLRLSFVQDMDSIDAIISMCIYHGDIISVLNYIENQTTKDKNTIYKEKRDIRTLEKDWHIAKTIFSLGNTPPIVPENIRLHADCSQQYGERIVYDKQDIDSRAKGKKRSKFAKIAGFRKSKKLVRNVIKDKNITQNIYTFQNGFTFTWNVAICPSVADLPIFLESVSNFMGI